MIVPVRQKLLPNLAPPAYTEFLQSLRCPTRRSAWPGEFPPLRSRSHSIGQAADQSATSQR